MNLLLQSSSDIPTALINNPAVVQGGIGAVIAVMLILVLWRMLVRIDDSIHKFTDGQHEMADKISDSVREAMNHIHGDNTEVLRAVDRLTGRIDLLIDRQDRTFEQVAIHRGVAESPRPAIVTPKENPRR